MSRLTYAVRSLRREPALVLGVIATFTLAIGVNAAMFGLVTRLMLGAPPGIAAPDRVSRVVLQVRTEDGEQYPASTTSYPIFRGIADGARAALSSVAAAYPTRLIMGQGPDAREIDVVAASGGYFATLGARPALGRFFGPGDDQLPAGNAVAVLSHAFFARVYGGDPAIIGTTMDLDGTRYTIVGVAAANFSGDNVSAVDVFAPLAVVFRNRGTDWVTNAEMNLVSVVARLRDGVTPGAASGAILSALRGVESTRARRVVSVDLASLVPAAVRDSPSARIARWLLGVSLVVLTIATANVGTLLLLRSIRKRRDIAIRMALGAATRQIAAQLSVESLLLAGAGGAAGVLLSRWLSELARATLLPNLAPSDAIVDPRVLLAGAVLSVVAGAVAGLAPLVLVSPRRLTADLHGAGTLGGIDRSRAQRFLVGTQVALCTVLLVGAGLFVRSLQRVQGQQLGFDPARLLHVTLDIRDPLSRAQSDELHRDVARRLAGAPGITGATIADAMPFGSFHVPPISVPGRPEPPMVEGQPPFMYGATPEYLRLLGVTLLQGRLLTVRDRAGSPLVVLVNETMAREVWPGQSAVGQCIRLGFDPAQEPSMLAPETLPCREVVGVVRDSRARSLRPVNREASLMQYYVPFDQMPPPPFAGGAVHVSGLIVGVASEPARMATVVQKLIQGSTRVSIYARVRPYQDLLDPQLRPWRLGATLFVLFGGLALGIASVGLFGVISYLVTQRTREIGLRLALGGTGAAIGRSVIVAALRMVAWGIATGAVVAAAVGPAARAQLFETSPFDAGVFTVAGMSLLLVTVTAALVPAWRAARVSPMTALREE